MNSRSDERRNNKEGELFTGSKFVVIVASSPRPPAPGGMLDGWAMDGRLWMLWKLPSATPQRSIACALWPLCRAMVQWSLLASTLLASCQDGLPVAHWIWLPDSNPLVARQPGCLLARWLEWGLPLAPQGTASTLG